MRKILIGSAALLVLVTTGACAADRPTPSPTSAAATSGDVDAFLADYDLAGRTVTEIVELLDATNDDREHGPVGSVTATRLTLSDAEREISLPIDDTFYLSIAPYVTGTHDCYNHNLASCQGELVSEELEVTITDADGATIFDGPATTGPNGFAGFWLPRDTVADVTVTHAGRTATAQVSTGPEDPTCLTTMQLN